MSYTTEQIKDLLFLKENGCDNDRVCADCQWAKSLKTGRPVDCLLFEGLGFFGVRPFEIPEVVTGILKEIIFEEQK